MGDVEFRGKVRVPEDATHNTDNTGKKKCDILKSIRSKLGDKLGININTEECTHGENCNGTCPACDAEAAKISAELLRDSTDRINNTQISTDKTEDDVILVDEINGDIPDTFEGELIDNRADLFEDDEDNSGKE